MSIVNSVKLMVEGMKGISTAMPSSPEAPFKSTAPNAPPSKEMPSNPDGPGSKTGLTHPVPNGETNLGKDGVSPRTSGQSNLGRDGVGAGMVAAGVAAKKALKVK